MTSSNRRRSRNLDCPTSARSHRHGRYSTTARYSLQHATVPLSRWPAACMPACRPAFRPRARASAGFKNARWASAPELGTAARYRLYRAMSFISFISSELRLAIIYIIRVRACIASVSDCVRPHMPLYDRVYSPETAYIYVSTNCAHTSRLPTRRVLRTA